MVESLDQVCNKNSKVGVTRLLFTIEVLLILVVGRFREHRTLGRELNERRAQHLAILVITSSGRFEVMSNFPSFLHCSCRSSTVGTIRYDDVAEIASMRNAAHASARLILRVEWRAGRTSSA
jgi:hypothetical protein